MTVSSVVLGCALKGELESATLIIHESARESAKTDLQAAEHER
jgi:hypothetical protein